MSNAFRLLLCLGCLLALGTTAAAQPADFTPEQRAIYENYRLSIEVRSSSGYIARPVGPTGDAYQINSYYVSSWRAKRGQRGVQETTFYEAAGRPEVAEQIRREIRSDWMKAGLGLGMIGGAVGLATLGGADFTEGGTPNVPLMGVLFLGIGGTYVFRSNLNNATAKKTSATVASDVADQYNAVLIEEIRRAGPNAGAGGR